jgi:hypothetical protein
MLIELILIFPDSTWTTEKIFISKLSDKVIAAGDADKVVQDYFFDEMLNTKKYEDLVQVSIYSF